MEVGRFFYFVVWMLLMLPMLLGAGWGWALGIEWRGRSLVHHWSRKHESPALVPRSD